MNGWERLPRLQNRCRVSITKEPTWSTPTPTLIGQTPTPYPWDDSGDQKSWPISLHSWLRERTAISPARPYWWMAALCGRCSEPQGLLQAPSLDCPWRTEGTPLGLAHNATEKGEGVATGDFLYVGVGIATGNQPLLFRGTWPFRYNSCERNWAGCHRNLSP